MPRNAPRSGNFTLSLLAKTRERGDVAVPAARCLPPKDDFVGGGTGLMGWVGAAVPTGEMLTVVAWVARAVGALALRRAARSVLHERPNEGANCIDHLWQPRPWIDPTLSQKATPLKGLLGVLGKPRRHGLWNLDRPRGSSSAEGGPGLPTPSDRGLGWDEDSALLQGSRGRPPSGRRGSDAHSVRGGIAPVQGQIDPGRAGSPALCCGLGSVVAVE